MLKRLSATLLAGPLLLGLIPTAADAAPARPEGGARSSAQDNRTIQPFDHRDDDHYRCMYRCEGRERYDRDRYDRDRYRRYDRCRYASDRSRYGRCRYNRTYHGGDCWYHDGDRWRRCRGYRYSGYHGWYGHNANANANAGGGYNSHRQHDR